MMISCPKAQLNLQDKLTKPKRLSSTLTTHTHSRADNLLVWCQYSMLQILGLFTRGRKQTASAHQSLLPEFLERVGYLIASTPEIFASAWTVPRLKVTRRREYTYSHRHRRCLSFFFIQTTRTRANLPFLLEGKRRKLLFSDPGAGGMRNCWNWWRWTRPCKHVE
jgi:hypothetical protein